MKRMQNREYEFDIIHFWVRNGKCYRLHPKKMRLTPIFSLLFLLFYQSSPFPFIFLVATPTMLHNIYPCQHSWQNNTCLSLLLPLQIQTPRHHSPFPKNKIIICSAYTNKNSSTISDKGLIPPPPCRVS